MNGPSRQIAFINAAHMLCHYSLLILPTAVLAMLSADGRFGSAYGEVVALATGMFVLYGVLSLPQGWLAARIGRARLITIYFFGTGGALVACGFAQTAGQLALALAAAGGFAAIYHPIGTAMLVDAAGDRPGKQLGLNGVCGNVGVATAPVVTALLARQFGWPVAFIAPGLLCVGLGVAWARLPGPGLNRGVARPFPAIPRTLVRQAVIVLLLIAVVSGLVFNAFTILIPKLLQERLGTDPAALPMLGAAAFGVTLCGALTQLTIGRAIDRVTLRRVFLPLGLALAPALALLALVQGWLMLPLAGLAAAAIFGQVTVNETMTARYIAPALRARMYSVRFFVGFLGAAAAPPVVAFLHSRTGGMTAVLLVLAAAALVTLGCAWFFPDREEELRPELWARLAPETAD